MSAFPMLGAAAFNLLFNAATSFVLALGVALLVLRLARVDSERWRLYFLTLPFLKIVYDVARWIPGDSFLWTGIEPTPAATKRTLMAWLGLNDFGPYLGVGMRVLSDGHRYSLSFADFAASWLRTHLAPALPGALATATLGVSALLVARRLAAWVAHERTWRRAIRAERVEILFTTSVRGRPVTVVLADTDSAVPFASGCWSPYVVIPRATFAALQPAERAAVIAHELAHVRNHDLPQALAVALLGDVFWFVPGYRWLGRKVDDLRELVADRAAIGEGADPVALAAALVKTRALAPARLVAPRAVCSTLLRRTPLLERRVRALTAAPAAPRRPARVRAFLAVLGTTAVLGSSLGGNRATAGMAARDPLSHLDRALWFLSGMFYGGTNGP